jgi:hypothetical protein
MALKEIESGDKELLAILAAMVKHRCGKQKLVKGSWVDVWP